MKKSTMNAQAKGRAGRKSSSRRAIVPGAQYVGYRRVPLGGALMSKTRHVWNMGKDGGFVTHFRSEGKRRAYYKLIAEGEKPTKRQLAEMLVKVPVYRAYDAVVVKAARRAPKKADELKARQGVLGRILAGA